MWEKLEEIKHKYLDLQKKILVDNTQLKDINVLKKKAELEKIVSLYDAYLKYKTEQQKIIQMLKTTNIEEEFRVLLQQEKIILEKKIASQTIQLQTFLLAKIETEEDYKNVIIEIKGAAGGNESNLFVNDLFRAYIKYAEMQKWKTEIIHLAPNLKNGMTSVTFMFYGQKIYPFLKYESGVHRVQRVPLTERQGRIHTSTAKILVTPEIKQQKLNLNWNDIRVDTFNASGPGGQSVNTTKSAVRLTHLPTGMSVASQVMKSQHQNKEKAFQLLQSKIYYQMFSCKQKEINDMKKQLVGKGNRSEKIRTYNYAQNRITDHRVNLTLQKLDLFMEGKIDLVILPLINILNQQKLKDFF